MARFPVVVGGCVIGVDLGPKVPIGVSRLLCLRTKNCSRHMIRRSNRDSLLRKEHTPEKWKWAGEMKKTMLKSHSPVRLGHLHSTTSPCLYLQVFPKFAHVCRPGRGGFLVFLGQLSSFMFMMVSLFPASKVWGARGLQKSVTLSSQDSRMTPSSINVDNII